MINSMPVQKSEDVSKGARLDKLASSRAGKRYLKDAPLKENEFYHGTTSESAKKIKNEGFRLANPKEKVIRGEQQRSKTGRPVSSSSNKEHLGPGVYLTRSKNYASSYPQEGGFFIGQSTQTGIKDKSRQTTLRVAVPKNSKFMSSDAGRQGKTPQATKAGYQGVADEYIRFEGDKGTRNMYAFANPRNVKVVNNRYRPTSQAGKDAAVIAAVGGAGYGTGKIKKGLPSSFKGKVMPWGYPDDLPKAVASKVSAHVRGKEISRKVASGHYKKYNEYTYATRHLPDNYGDKLFRTNVKSARFSRRTPANVDVQAAKRTGKFESSFAGRKAELYRQERLSRVNKGIRRIPGQMEIPGMGDVVRQTAKRRLPVEGRWKHLSGKTSRIRIVGPNSSVKGSFDVIDSKDYRRILPKDRISFMKPDDVTKSLEYSVPMNQSRFGGSGAVGRNLEDVEKGVRLDKFAETKAGKRYLKYDLHSLPKRPKRDEKGIPYLEAKYKATKEAKRDAAIAAVTSGGVAGTGVAIRKDTPVWDQPDPTKSEDHLSKKKKASAKARARAAGRPYPNLIDNMAMSKAEQQYDQMGNPVPARKPLMSGNAKLGAAGTAIGLAGAQRMASAGTLPSRLQGQSDAIASKVKFNERLANDQIQRVQSASQIPNRFTRNKQVRMHQYYSDKAQSTLADSRAKQVAADNALKAAPAKKLAHLKSGAGLVATGGVMGGLAVYNNAKDRKNKAQTK